MGAKAILRRYSYGLGIILTFVWPVGQASKRRIILYQTLFGLLGFPHSGRVAFGFARAYTGERPHL
jgi:hypothetical protein